VQWAVHQGYMPAPKPQEGDPTQQQAQARKQQQPDQDRDIDVPRRLDAFDDRMDRSVLVVLVVVDRLVDGSVWGVV
jgi:hypothetical protein